MKNERTSGKKEREREREEKKKKLRSGNVLLRVLFHRKSFYLNNIFF